MTLLIIPEHPINGTTTTVLIVLTVGTQHRVHIRIVLIDGLVIRGRKQHTSTYFV